MSRALKRGEEWAPAPSVVFQPVPFKLLRVVAHGGRELVAGEDMGALQGHPFDPWKRGDLVVICRILRSYSLKGPPTESQSWRVGRRHTNPSQVRHRVAVTVETDDAAPICWEVPYGRDGDLWRIPYRWRPAAEQLIGQEYETREALEAAMEATQCHSSKAA